MRALARKNCVVVCIGNPLMGDDGIGIEVARSLGKSSLGGNVLVLQRQTLDVSILYQAEGASKPGTNRVLFRTPTALRSQGLMPKKAYFPLGRKPETG